MTASLAMASVLLVPLSAQAQTSTHHFSSAAISRAKTFWASAAVPASVQARLTAKLESGSLPDAAVPGASPSSVVTQREGDLIVSRSTFADGSVSTASLEEPLAGSRISVKAANSPATYVKYCSTSGTSGATEYTGCNVEGDNGFVKIIFIADYWLSQSAYAIIPNTGRNAGTVCNGTSCSTPNRTGYRKTETATAPAMLQYHTWYSGVSTNSGDAYLTLNVRNNKASASFSI